MKKLYLSLLFLSIVFNGFGTHNRGAEITYKHISGYTYLITIITYSRTSSPADRPILDSVHFGDGDTGVFIRQYKDSIAPDVSKNFYQDYHTYPGQGAYIIYFEDPNRDAEIVNIPNSVNVPLYVDCYIVVFDDSKYCVNNSAYFSADPILSVPAGKDYHQNVTAIDPDGDSLSYELVPCKGDGGMDIQGYTLPPGVSINSFNGELAWKGDSLLGAYDFAIRVNEWRRQYLVGYTIRDYVLFVLADPNNKYTFVQNNSFPVDSQANYVAQLNAGDSLNLSFYYSDPNDATNILAYSDAFSAPSPALFTTVDSTNKVNALLKWIVSPSDVRNAPYVFTFRGISAYTGTETDLTFTAYTNGIGHDTCPAFLLPALYEINNDLLIYPDPVKEKLTINFMNLGGGQIIIYSVLGQVCMQSEIVNNQPEIELDVSTLSFGVYFVLLTGETGGRVGRFVKE